jgi:hypothetical protein
MLLSTTCILILGRTMSEAKVNLTPGSKVWVRSVKKVGMVIRVEWDRQYGPQYLVSLHDAENIEDTHPYIQRWFKSKDVEPTAVSNPRPR